MASGYALRIKKESVAKDVEDCVKKELAFDSESACAKILQTGKYDATIGSERAVALSSVVSFPIEVFCYLYDSATQNFTQIDAEFDANYIYLPGASKASGSYYYFFICYS